MKISDKQKKLIWAGALLIALTRFGPDIITAIRQAISSHSSVSQQQWKPSPARPMLVPVDPIERVPPPSPDAQMTSVLGRWLGGGRVPDGRICRLGLDLKLSQEQPGNYSGYSVLFCGPSAALVNLTSPVTTILTGPVVDGSIQFHVEKQIGTANGCPVTSMTITPFTDGFITAAWKAGSCRGGNLILQPFVSPR